MKKFIALILALVMVFSLATVAFAAGTYIELKDAAKAYVNSVVKVYSEFEAVAPVYGDEFVPKAKYTELVEAVKAIAATVGELVGQIKTVEEVEDELAGKVDFVVDNIAWALYDELAYESQAAIDNGVTVMGTIMDGVSNFLSRATSGKIVANLVVNNLQTIANILNMFPDNVLEQMIRPE